MMFVANLQSLILEYVYHHSSYIYIYIMSHMRHVFKAGVLAALSQVVLVFILDISSLVKILQVIQSAGRVKEVADPCAIGERPMG